MGPLFVLAIVVAALVPAVGLQVLSRRMQRFPLDGRRPDLLIDVTSTRRSPSRPAELVQLTNIVADAMSSPAIARTELQPLFHDLAASAPGSGTSDPTGTIEDAIDELETAWGLPERG